MAIVGETDVLVVVAPVLQLYVKVPPPVNAVLCPLQMTVGLAIAVTVG